MGYKKILLISGDSQENPCSKLNLHSVGIVTTYNLSTIIHELSTREQGVEFAEKHGLILKSKNCEKHGKPMKIVYYINKLLGTFVCRIGTCYNKNRVSRSDDTWFSQLKLGLPRLYYLMYCFAHRWPYDQVMWEEPARVGRCLSSATIAAWYGHCREAVVTYQLDKQKYTGKIGGPGKIVQIAESKFGKRKSNKGKQLEGHWVLGLIEVGSDDLRLEVCSDNIRSADVLVPLIKKHVHPGSTIHTDNDSAYDCLSDHGFIHKKDSSTEPEDPLEAGNCTRTKKFESQWHIVKLYFAKYNNNCSDNFSDLIVEYLWRRYLEKSKQDPFMELVKAVTHVYGVNKTK